MEQQLRDAVTAAAGRDEVVAAVGRVYADLQAAIDARRPRCDASGRCCRFEQYGHRLYVTTLELAAFVREVSAARRPLSVAAAGDPSPAARRLPVLSSRETWDGTGCPYQIHGLCGVHVIRPFGCRVFFCDETSTGWQHEAYERFHTELKRLHDSLSVPYAYVEWRAALTALGLARRGDACVADSR